MKKDKKFAGADERTPSRAQYFSWINNTNEGSTEEQTLAAGRNFTAEGQLAEVGRADLAGLTTHILRQGIEQRQQTIHREFRTTVHRYIDIDCSFESVSTDRSYGIWYIN